MNNTAQSLCTDDRSPDVYTLEYAGWPTTRRKVPYFQSIVLAIGFGVPTFVFMCPSLGVSRDCSPRAATKAILQSIATGLEMYHNDTGQWPSRSSDLLRAGPEPFGGPDVDPQVGFVDKWTRPITYRPPPPKASAQPPGTLRSAGQDGLYGTPDDVVSR